MYISEVLNLSPALEIMEDPSSTFQCRGIITLRRNWSVFLRSNWLMKLTTNNMFCYRFAILYMLYKNINYIEIVKNMLLNNQ